MLVYLGICAALAFLAALLALIGAVPPAPTFHLAFAAGAMPLVFGAIIHFVPVLTRGSAPALGVRLLPLAAQAAGVVTPLGLAGVLPVWSLHAAATCVALAALALAQWVIRRLRLTLGAPHPGAHWYGAALLYLFMAVSLVPVWLALPALQPALRLFHLHLNTLGFIGLAALGTLPVLLPTALGGADAGAADRLRKDLPYAAIGAVFVAAGAAAASLWMGLAGALLLGWVVLRNLLAWYGNYGMSRLIADGAAAPLVVANMGFFLLLLAGVAHGAGWISARPASGAYAALFLLPLVTGALTQLLPVWRHPGNDSSARRALRTRVARGGQLRALLFLSGGLLFLAGLSGTLMTAAALMLFVVDMARAFWLDRSGRSDDNSRPNS